MLVHGALRNEERETHRLCVSWEIVALKEGKCRRQCGARRFAEQSHSAGFKCSSQGSKWYTVRVLFILLNTAGGPGGGGSHL